MEVKNLGKGQKSVNIFKKYNDKYTGRKVVRLTSDKYISHHPYFYNKMITNDGRYLIYASNRDGNRNYYKLDLMNGANIQLTDGYEIDDFSACLSGNDKFLFYINGDSVIRLDMDSLNEEIIYKTPEKWKIGAFGMSSDDKFMLVNEMNKKDIVQNNNWSAFETQWAVKPNCRLIYIDVDNKRSRVIHEEAHCWLGHPQIRPHNNNVLMFCHEGPGTKIDARIWLINSDGTNLRCATPKEPDEVVTTHEYWINNGSKIAFMHRQINGRTTIRYVDPITLKIKELMECSNYCHFTSDSKNTIIVGDAQPPVEPFLFIVDVASRKEEKLCFHGTSWKSYGSTQDCHPHPAFTPDENAIIFTSDMDGKPCVYKVEI
ncbi:MAG TPA: hypothetical protein DD426_07405 [Clostridiaceae bacterium]|nr:hypothetical protein [Clostridiaceae bacterium]